MKAGDSNEAKISVASFVVSPTLCPLEFDPRIADDSKSYKYPEIPTLGSWAVVNLFT